MNARIVTTRTQDGENTRMRDYETELEAQNAFDELTKNGSEWSGYLQWDLEVNHPNMGWICRRTMYTEQ